MTLRVETGCGASSGPRWYRAESRATATVARPQVAPMLSVALEVDGSQAVLRLRGALLATSVAALAAQIDQLGCTPCGNLVVDLKELADIDAIGVSALSGLRHYVRGRGGRIELFGAQPQVEHALGATALGVAT